MICKLRDIAIFNPRETLHKDHLYTKIEMSSLKPYCRDFDIPDKKELFRGGTKFRNGDTLMARITPCLENGKIAQVRGLKADEVAFGSTEYIVFRAREGICDQDYLYYLISSPVIRAVAIRSMNGTSGRQRVQQAALEEHRLVLPELGTQRKVAQLLNSIDDKIRLNQTINGCLEAQLDTLLKNFLCSNSFSQGKLKDILKIVKDARNAGEDPALPYVPIDVIPMHSLALVETRPNSEAQSSLLRFRKNDILIGAMRVYFHRVSLAPFDGLTRTTCFVLRPIKPEFLAYSLLICNRDESIAFAQKTSKGSTMPYAIWDGGLGELTVPIPDFEKIVDFNKAALPMIEKIVKSFSETRRLIKLRDSLLPKLMSGELDVDSIKID